VSPGAGLPFLVGFLVASTEGSLLYRWLRYLPCECRHGHHPGHHIARRRPTAAVASLLVAGESTNLPPRAPQPPVQPLMRRAAFDTHTGARTRTIRQAHAQARRDPRAQACKHTCRTCRMQGHMPFEQIAPNTTLPDTDARHKPAPHHGLVVMCDQTTSRTAAAALVTKAWQPALRLRGMRHCGWLVHATGL
jgi:hypothetical protein